MKRISRFAAAFRERDVGFNQQKLKKNVKNEQKKFGGLKAKSLSLQPAKKEELDRTRSNPLERRN